MSEVLCDGKYICDYYHLNIKHKDTDDHNISIDNGGCFLNDENDFTGDFGIWYKNGMIGNLLYAFGEDIKFIV
jgi:hypothetical protein